MATRRRVTVPRRRPRPEEELEALLRRIADFQKRKEPDMVKKTSAA
jgi:hypothetical protein